MRKTIKAVKPKSNNDCNCGKPVKRTQKRKIIYKKIIKKR